VPDLDPRHETGFLDWLACAAGGAREPAARAARAAGDGRLERVVAAGTAGHVLDFDDTYEPGLVHLSAPVAPAALVTAAETGASVGEALGAYAEGFEAMAAVARASHPALYDRGWHPTAVLGPVGSATAAARLLGADPERAVALALLRAGGLRAAFGSDGKALQVGMAAAAGVEAARLVAAGADVLATIPTAAAGFEAAAGATWAHPDPGDPAVQRNWIKAYPCCLQTHGALEAAAALPAAVRAGAEALAVVVHPISRQAAPLDDVATRLQAKFSIPYIVAWAMRHGPPGVGAFASLDPEVRAQAAARVRVETDPALGTAEAVIRSGGEELTRVTAPLGSPARPLDAAALAAKVRGLAGDRLDGALDDPGVAAAEVLAAALPDSGP